MKFYLTNFSISFDADVFDFTLILFYNADFWTYENISLSCPIHVVYVEIHVFLWLLTWKLLDLPVVIIGDVILNSDLLLWLLY